MIDAINRNNYAYTIKANDLKKIKQTNDPIYSAPIYDQNKHQDVWKSYQYCNEKESVQVRSEWDQYKEMLIDNEEELGKLYERGYEVDTLTLGEIQYISGNMENKESRSFSGSSYEPIEKKIDRIKEHPDSMYRYGMEQGTLTINGLYQATYTGEHLKGVQYYTKDDVTKVLGYNNLKPTEGNMWAAEKLMGIGLDVTKDAVVKLQNTYAAIEGLDKQEESMKAMEDLEEGKEPGNRPLIEEEKILYTEKDIQEIIDDLTKIEDANIEEVVGKDKEITIGNLRESMLKNTKQVLKGNQSKNKVSNNLQEQGEGQKVDQEKENKLADVKDQIREIRAMLNTESARKLSEKMPLESTELVKVAEELRHIQDATIEDAAHKVDLVLNEGTKEQIKQVMEAAIMMARHKDIAVGIVSQENTGIEQADITVETIHEALSAYEEVGTIPEKRFGETIHKLTDEIHSFLERNQLPKDQITVESSKALITNDMDLTVEHIDGVKEALLKINTIIEDFTPYQAAVCIKEGINPYKASLNHLVEWLGEQQLPKLQDTVAGAIVTLEHKGKINEEQKQSLIGLYRILGTVKNNKEQVAGYLFKNEMPLTVEKLEEAIKYGIKGLSINQEIDENFGELEDIVYHKQTARDKMYEAKEQTDKLIDVAKLLEHMELPISKENMDKLTQIKTMIYPMIKATVKEELGKFEGIDVLPDSVKEKIEALNKVHPEVIQVMEKQRIPINLANVYWMQKLYEDPELYKKMLKKEELIDKAFPESFKEMEEQISVMEDEVVAQKEKCIAQGDMTGYKSYKQMEEMVGVQKQLSVKEGLYQIPFIIHGETKLVNLYIHQKSHKKDIKKESIEAVISYDTKQLGNIKAYLTLKEDSVNYKVVGESKEATRMLEKGGQALRTILDSLGYAVQKAIYDTECTQSVKPVTMVLQGDSQFEMIV